MKIYKRDYQEKPKNKSLDSGDKQKKKSANLPSNDEENQYEYEVQNLGVLNLNYQLLKIKSYVIQGMQPQQQSLTQIRACTEKIKKSCYTCTGESHFVPTHHTKFPRCNR